MILTLRNTTTVVGAALLMACFGEPPRSAAGMVREHECLLSGTDNEQPLSGATARIVCPEGLKVDPPTELTSDAQGRFRVERATSIPFKCEVVVSAPGHVTRHYLVSDHCQIAPPQATEDVGCHNLFVDATLLRASAIAPVPLPAASAPATTGVVAP